MHYNKYYVTYKIKTKHENCVNNPLSIFHSFQSCKKPLGKFKFVSKGVGKRAPPAKQMDPVNIELSYFLTVSFS